MKNDKLSMEHILYLLNLHSDNGFYSFIHSVIERRILITAPNEGYITHLLLQTHYYYPIFYVWPINQEYPMFRE